MLETVDFSAKKMSKEEYKREREEVLDRLVVLQQRARSEGVGLVVLFEGWNGAGKGSRISDLMYELDARATSVYVTEDLDEESLLKFPGRKHGVSGFYPDMQQFWGALGERGTITFFDRGWYTVGIQRMLSTTDSKEHELVNERLVRCLADAEIFERQLEDDGYVVVKFFVHMSKSGQKKRLEKLAANPATAWRATKKKRDSIGNYDRAYEFYDLLLKGSTFGFAPWHVLNGEDKRRANITIARVLADEIENKLAEIDAARAVADAGEGAPECASVAPRASHFAIMPEHPRVDGIDHSLALPKDRYLEELEREQKRLFQLESLMYCARIPLMIMFEGWDAAGKGGAIKRVAQALDARAYTIFPSPAPTKSELMHPHLWRYWTRLPKAGHVGIYDRSWYGRVLVERVEGFATPAQWRRAYDEINEFEREMVEWGAILLKFWVDISPDEQLKRFHEREQDPTKQWKITPDDWRNREKYPAYKQAVDDMFRLTSTTLAPWTVLESEDKRYARVKALKTINAALEERLGNV